MWLRRLRRLYCRLAGHEWTLKATVQMQHLDPVPPEMVVYFREQSPFDWREEMVKNVWVECRNESWVCTRCGARVPLGQSEGALHG